MAPFYGLFYEPSVTELFQNFYSINIPFNYSHLNAKVKNIIYPEENKTCAAILLNNLAQPEWITVNCDESLSPHVLCAFPVPNDKHSHPILSETKLRVYGKSCVIRNSTCFYLCSTLEMVKSLSRVTNH